MSSRNKQDGSFIENQIVINPYGETFQIEAFDAAIRSQGVCLKHYSATPCPIGMVDKEDIRKSNHDDHGAKGVGACSNGFLYKYIGDLTALFINNTTRDTVRDEGTISGSTVNITLPRFYDTDKNKEVKVLPFDRLFFAEDITVENWQLVQSNLGGYDRLTYPAVSVSSLIDSDGTVYNLGDFEIINGQIHWTGQNRPSMNPDTGKGMVYSIRYSYTPFYYVRDMIHEIRHTQTRNINGERVTIKMPQTIVATREYVFQNEQNDEQSVTPNSPRQIKKPESGGFGTR